MHSHIMKLSWCVSWLTCVLHSRERTWTCLCIIWKYCGLVKHICVRQPSHNLQWLPYLSNTRIIETKADLMPIDLLKSKLPWNLHRWCSCLLWGRCVWQCRLQNVGYFDLASYNTRSIFFQIICHSLPWISPSYLTAVAKAQVRRQWWNMKVIHGA